MALSDEQKAIVEQVDGRMIVVACPGSGKTTTMLERVHYMISEKNIKPSDILVVTFTKAAAVEMQERYSRKYENEDGVCFATIHSICFSILRQEFGLSANNILKEWEQIKHFKEKLKDSIDKIYLEDAAKMVIGKISYARNAGLDPCKEFQTLDLFGAEVKFPPLYKSYEKLKKESNKIDFDDMLILCLDLLKKNAVALNKYQNLYKYIIIDEYQDTNKVQANIFYLLSAVHGNLCVVGDDDQSIYGFRSADSSIMLSFKKKFPDAKKFSLSTNYRSGSKIVQYAGKLISNNSTRFKKKFVAGIEDAGELYLGHYEDELLENIAIIKWIEDNHNNGTEYKDMALLYRTNKEAISILPLLKKKEIPVSIKENPGNIHNHYIFEAVRCYYILSNMYDDKKDCIPEEGIQYLIKILNCPSRYLKTEFFKECNLSVPSIKKCIKEYFKTNEYNSRRYERMLDAFEDLKCLLTWLKGKNPKRFLKTLVNSDFEKWVKDSAEFRQTSYETAKAIMHDIISEGESFETMEEWMDYVGEYQEFLDGCGNNPNGIRLSTFHGAKGLEWEHVWVRNVTKGNVPSKLSLEENGDAGMEEERRMFYVAVTRAKKDVQISYIDKPSMFITEMENGKDVKPITENKQFSFTEIGLV